MTPEALATMAGQWGLITRRQALEAGVSADALRRRLRAGAWIVVRRGVYVERDHWDALDDWHGRPLLRVRAAHLCVRGDHVMSHDSAALLHGMPVLLGSPELVHVTLQARTGGRTEYGVKHHVARFNEEQVTVVDGIKCLDPARTAVDIAREHGLDRGVVACDAALRLGVSRRQLEAARAAMWCWPGVTRADEAIAVADPGAESVGESLSRLLVLELGIGRPQTQFELWDDARRVACDLRVRRHIFEFDGKVKYLDRSRGGVGDRPPEEIVWDEKRRQDFVCGFKLGMSRIIWADLWGAQRRAAKLRLRREYDDTVARFGGDTSDLPGARD